MLAAIDRLLQQPTATAWLLLIIAIASAIVVVCSVLGLAILRLVGKQFIQRAAFSEQAQPLLDQGNLDTLIEKCRARLALFNDDAAAHYFLGVALHRKGELRQALVHLKRIPELQAGWDVGPMIQAVEAKLTASDAKPGLKAVVKSPPDGEPDPT